MPPPSWEDIVAHYRWDDQPDTHEPVRAHSPIVAVPFIGRTLSNLLAERRIYSVRDLVLLLNRKIPGHGGAHWRIRRILSSLCQNPNRGLCKNGYLTREVNPLCFLALSITAHRFWNEVLPPARRSVARHQIRAACVDHIRWRTGHGGRAAALCPCVPEADCDAFQDPTRPGVHFCRWIPPGAAPRAGLARSEEGLCVPRFKTILEQNFPGHTGAKEAIEGGRVVHRHVGGKAVFLPAHPMHRLRPKGTYVRHAGHEWRHRPHGGPPEPVIPPH